MHIKCPADWAALPGWGVQNNDIIIHTHPFLGLFVSLLECWNDTRSSLCMTFNIKQYKDTFLRIPLFLANAKQWMPQNFPSVQTASMHFTAHENTHKTIRNTAGSPSQCEWRDVNALQTKKCFNFCPSFLFRYCLYPFLFLIHLLLNSLSHCTWLAAMSVL